MSSNTRILILIFVIVVGLFGVWWFYEGDNFDYDFSTSGGDNSFKKLQSASSSDTSSELDSIEAEFEAGIAQ